MCRFVFLILIFWFSSNIYSQSIYGGFDNNFKPDFKNKAIKNLFQDSYGYLWIGTSRGICRYDGIFQDSFNKMDHDSKGMGDKVVACMDQEPGSNIYWAGTAIGGVVRMDIVNYDYQSYYIQPDSTNGTGFVQVKAICCIDKNTILVGSLYQGLYYFYPERKEFVPFSSVYKVDFELSNNIESIHKGNNFIWVVTAHYIMQFSRKGVYLHTFFFNGKNFSNKSSCDDKKIDFLIENKDGNILFTSDNLLCKYNWAEKKLIKLYRAPGSYRLNYIQEDNSGGYWVGSYNHGLIYFDKKSNTDIKFNNNSSKNFIAGNNITSLLLVQNKSVLWCGTNKGLLKYDYHKSKFRHFDIDKLSNHKISIIYSLFKDSQNGYWVRSKDGLYYKGVENTYFRKLFSNSKYFVRQFWESDSCGLWLTTNKGVLNYSLDSKNQKLYTFHAEGKDEYRLNQITSIIPYKDNKIFLLSFDGLILFDIDTHEYKVFDFFKDHSLKYYFSTCLLSTDSSSLWIGNRRGELRKFDIATNEYKLYKLKDLLPEKKKPFIILDMAMDNDGKLWLGTYGRGLLVYDPKTNSISDDLAYDMLESYVYGILKDHNGYFWFSTNNGICKINTKTKEVENFGEKDGTFCQEFNNLSFCKAKDGTLLFGGYGGFIEVNSDSIYKNEYAAKIYIAAMLSENKTVEYNDAIWDQVTYLNDTVVDINGLRSSVKFYISMIDYSRSIENKLKWKLEGFDNQWNVDDISDVIKYNNLDEGSYVLLVKGVNYDGVETQNTARLRINIKADFFHSCYFKIIIVFVIAIIIYLLIRLRFVWYSKQEQRLLIKVDEKTKELTGANKELESIQATLLNQKTELEIHRNNLEDIVRVRTQDLERAKVKAEESDRLKTAFLANLSHEIRTPMNAIIGFSSLLRTEEFEEEQRHHFLQVIGQSSETLLALINDIIDISRIETGTIELINKEVYLHQLIKETMDELIFEEKSEAVVFLQNINLEEEDERIIIDRYRLKQIISNLLRNAFKFTHEGHVKLSICSVDTCNLKYYGFEIEREKEDSIHPVLFIVEDTGIGIHADKTKLIFEPFQKAVNNNYYYKGMGLGLSIVKNLIQLFGGDIIVNSIVGEGSTFVFYIDVNAIS